MSELLFCPTKFSEFFEKISIFFLNFKIVSECALDSQEARSVTLFVGCRP